MRETPAMPNDEIQPYQVKSLVPKIFSSSTTIYSTLSSWNPYTVVLMKSTLRDSDVIPTAVRDGFLTIYFFACHKINLLWEIKISR